MRASVCRRDGERVKAKKSMTRARARAPRFAAATTASGHNPSSPPPTANKTLAEADERAKAAVAGRSVVGWPCRRATRAEQRARRRVAAAQLRP